MANNEPIAIVGSGCRFAGGSNTPSKLWDVLRDPRDLRQEIPLDRFSVQGFYHPNGAYHGHSNVRHAYLLEEDPSAFDTDFFGIKPSEAKSMDPQQRLLMETVFEAVEAAGMTIPKLAGSDTAVFAGLMTNDYGMMLTRDLAHVPTYHATGISSAIVSNRVSYFFDWHGPSMTVDTGCSASLVALHLAVQALRTGECSMALACGTNLILGPEYFVIESKLKMLSRDGQSRMWDQNANGYARGEGVTAVVLKTLSAALRDGDHIECIIRETGINQDGATPGITMPSAAAQEALIRSTYTKAGLDLRKQSDRPHYFEAHGTGTPAGDPIEAEAISKAFFGDEQSAMEPLYCGSIKTVYGHTEGSAGIAAILKASLAIQNATIPPNLLFEKLSDRVAPFYHHLKIATSAKPWPQLSHGQVRRASVNSFGFGGANAHAILESYDEPVQNGISSPQRAVFTPFVFSASSERSLKATLTKFATFLGGEPAINFRDLAWTLRERRVLSSYRVAFTADSIVDLHSKILDRLEGDAPKIGLKALPSISSSAASNDTRLLGVFTGQGAQYARMGAELVESSQFARNILEELEQYLQELPSQDRPKWSLREELLAGSTTSRVHQAAISQPLCTAIQVLIVDLLRVSGVNFSAVVGHSSGEIAAAYAAGFLTAREAICVAYYRGLHLSAAVSPRGADVKGAMLAVGSSMTEMTSLCATQRFAGRISVAASNSSSSVTISGDEDAIEELQVLLNGEKKFNRRLKVDKAYHSAHMVPCSWPYVASLKACVRERQTQDTASTCLWFSSVTTKLVDPKSGVEAVYWADNMTNAVLFSQAITSASTMSSFDLALEVGAHPALKGPASQIIGETPASTSKTVLYCGTLDRGSGAVDAMSASLGQLWSLLDGTRFDLGAYERAMSGAALRDFKVVKGLPPYPWDHSTSHWHEARASRNMRLRTESVHPLLGDKTPDSTLHHLSWRNLLRIKEMEWVSGHEIQGQAVFPAAGYMCTALEASRLVANDEDIRLVEFANFTIHQAIVLPEDDAGVEVLVELSITPSDRSDCIQASFAYSAAIGANVETLTLAASADITVELGTSSTSLLPQGAPGTRLTHATVVDTDTFYSSLAEIGYDFNGPFRSLTQLSRKHCRSTCSVEVKCPKNDISLASLLLHPAELDAAFQAILLACSYPNDEQLRSLHLPTVIRQIRVNPALCKSRLAEGSTPISIDGVVIPSGAVDTSIVGDVNFYAKSSSNAMIQLEGAKLVPLGGAAAKTDDKAMFSTVHWINSQLDGTAKTSVSSFHREVMRTLERVSSFYLRQFNRQLSQGSQERVSPPLGYYADHAQRGALLVDSGKHGWANDEWRHDTLEEVIKVSDAYCKLPDVQLMHLVGEKMPMVFSGETTMMEEFRKGNLLSDYYTNGLVIQTSALWIINMMQQLVEVLPQMKILEIGAGAGEGVTQRIPQALNGTFSSYSYASIFGSVQKDGTAFFSKPSDPKPTLTFDPALDPSHQGFVEGSYDVVIAFWVMHATTNLESFLRNLRKLLKPGGRLIIAEGSYTASGSDGGLTFIFGTLPGWWLGASQGRTETPYLSHEEWNQALKLTGFSGVDVAAPPDLANTFGVRLFISQAVDQHINFLRNPTIQSYPDSLFRDLVIVGGLTPRVATLVRDLQLILSKDSVKITHYEKLQEIDYSSTDETTVFLSLIELDKPVFEDMTDVSFLAFKQIFQKGKTLLWVTNGRLENKPYSNLTLGFGRTAVVETPDLRLQYLDFSGTETMDPLEIAKQLLRFASKVPDTALWPIETEIIVDGTGQQLVPRLKPINAFNDRYNSTAREIKQLANIEELPIRLVRSGQTWSAQEVSVPSDCRASAEAHVDLEAVYTTSVAIKTTLGHFFLALCRRQGEPTMAGTYLALVPTLDSIYKLRKSAVATFSGTVADINLIVAHLISAHLVAAVRPGQTVVMHNATDDLAIVLSAMAAERAINLVFTADSTNAVAAQSSLILPSYSTRYEISRILPKEVALFVGLSAAGSSGRDNELAILACLHPTCRTESTETLYASHASSQSAADAGILREAVKTITGHCANGIPRSPAMWSLDSLLEDLQPLTPQTIIDWKASVELPVKVTRRQDSHQFAGDKTYWIIGLSAALAASLFDWMIERGAKNLAFSSRKPKLDPVWLEAQKKKGVRTIVIPCDVTDEEALRMGHSTITMCLPPVAGVLNGSALFRDSSISNMTFEQLNDVLRPKVLGSLNLDRIFHDHNLEFFILTSSITGLLGSAGQANYAAANTFLCGVAAHRRKRDLAATAINLGAIAGVGMLERGDQKVLQSIMKRLSLMPVSEGDFHQIFAEAIEAGRPDSTLCGPELTTALQAIPLDTPNSPSFFSSPTFSHYVLADSDQTTTKGSKAVKPLKVLLAECVTDDQLYIIIKDAFSNELRKALQTTTSDDDLMNMRSIDLGIDSLVSIDLRTWFTKNLKVNMPVLKIMSNDPMENLVAFAVENVPSDLLPNRAERTVPSSLVNGIGSQSSKAEINWDVETCPPEDLASFVGKESPSVILDPNIVLLTGATGLLGGHILTTLLEQSPIKKVICIAVRRLDKRLEKGELPQDSRVVYYPGELDQPRLGLSSEEAKSIFGEVGAVIHNGADTSHLKSYFDLRPANVDSTLELIRLCMPRGIPMHFVSSNAVGRYSNKAEIGEVPIYSLDAPKPPTDGTSGYRSTKWATEGLLERVHAEYKLPIWIHRPSTILRTGKDAEGLAAQLDWMNALIWYMNKLTAVPKLNHGTGFLDLVHARTVCTGIVSHVLGIDVEEPDPSKVKYVHHMADLLLPLAHLDEIGKGSGRVFRQLPREEWIAKAVAAGMHPAVVVLIEMMDAADLKGPPRFVKGPGSPFEPLPN